MRSFAKRFAITPTDAQIAAQTPVYGPWLATRQKSRWSAIISIPASVTANGSVQNAYSNEALADNIQQDINPQAPFVVVNLQRSVSGPGVYGFPSPGGQTTQFGFDFAANYLALFYTPNSSDSSGLVVTIDVFLLGWD